MTNWIHDFPAQLLKVWIYYHEEVWCACTYIRTLIIYLKAMYINIYTYICMIYMYVYGMCIFIYHTWMNGYMVDLSYIRSGCIRDATYCFICCVDVYNCFYKCRNSHTNLEVDNACNKATI